MWVELFAECKLLLSDWIQLKKPHYLWWSYRDYSAVPWREEASSYSSHISTGPAALPLTLMRQFHEILRFRCQRHRWQIMGTILDRRLTPESWFWRKKFIYMLTLLPKGVQTKYVKLSWLKILFHLPPVHRWCTLSCEYLCEFSLTIQNSQWDTQGLGGELFTKKSSSRKSCGTVPLKNCCFWFFATNLVLFGTTTQE